MLNQSLHKPLCSFLFATHVLVLVEICTILWLSGKVKNNLIDSKGLRVLKKKKASLTVHWDINFKDYFKGVQARCMTQSSQFSSVL